MSDKWTFISAHGAALTVIHRAPEATIVDLAARAGVSPRWMIKLIDDLAAEGYIVRERDGRRTSYNVNLGQPMRHAVTHDVQLGRLLSLFESAGGDVSETSTQVVQQLMDVRRELERERENLRRLRAERADLEASLQRARVALFGSSDPTTPDDAEHE